MSKTILSFVLILMLMAAAPVLAQSTYATITGAITDPQGLPIAGAQIAATHAASNYRYTAVTNEVGVYTLSQLREGAYTVEITAGGFKKFSAKDLELAAMNIRRLDARLDIGAVESTVEVTAGVSTIETETARISDTKDANILKTMPINSRSLWNFVGLNPGVAQASSSSAYRRFSGSRLNRSDASIDGITTNNGSDGGQISPLVNFIESYGEVRVDMANNTAEFSTLGQVTIVSKSGSNQLRGSAFDYYVTPMFRARDPFALERNTGVSHWPGYSVGGPVVLPKLYNGKDRTFFFTSYEQTMGSQAITLFTPTVPIAPWRTGNFSALSTAIKDPMNGGAAFPGNVIPLSRLNPVSLKIQEMFYPLPNFGNTAVFSSQNYRESSGRPFDTENYWTARIDHRLSEKSSLFGRFTYNRAIDTRIEGDLPTIGHRIGRRDTRSAVVSHTYTFSPNLLHEIRWGLAFNNQPRHGNINGKDLIEQLGIKGLVDPLPDIEGLMRVNFSGIGITAIPPTAHMGPGFSSLLHQWQDHLTWFHGRHTIKGGFALGRVGFYERKQPDNLFGNVTFSNRFTGHPYADFLLGIPTSSARAFPALEQDTLRWTYDFFITDEFKVTPKLTLSLGMRYELHPPARETNGYNSVFDVATGKIVIPDGTTGKISPLMPKNYVGVVEASQAGWTDGTLVRADRNNWAPRIAIAYRPWGNRTVFRTGYGIYYDVVPRGAGTIGTPFNLSEPTFTNPTTNPTVIFPVVFPSSPAGLSTVNLPNAVRPDIRVPYSMQYNFTIEHERWNTGFRLSYVGTNTRQGEYKYNINQPLPDTRLFVDKGRMYQNFPAISYYTNGAGHQYNGLTAEVKRAMRNGVHVQASYTWARDIGDLERADAPENAYDRGRERGVWIDVPTHRISGNFIYELPFGSGRRFLNRGKFTNLIAGGWDLSAVYVMRSGHFLTPTWTGPDPTGTAYTTSRTPAQVTIRPNQLRNGNLSDAERSIAQWFDVAAFSAPTPGFFGSSARGVIIGPGMNVWQAGIFKSIPITERMRLRAELTAINVFNHPNYAYPNMNITDAGTAGAITATGGVSNDLDKAGARSLRTGLRFEW